MWTQVYKDDKLAIANTFAQAQAAISKAMKSSKAEVAGELAVA